MRYMRRCTHAWKQWYRQLLQVIVIVVSQGSSQNDCTLKLRTQAGTYIKVSPHRHSTTDQSIALDHHHVHAASRVSEVKMTRPAFAGVCALRQWEDRPQPGLAAGVHGGDPGAGRRGGPYGLPHMTGSGLDTAGCRMCCSAVGSPRVGWHCFGCVCTGLLVGTDG